MTASYTYGADGLRKSKTVGGTTTTFVWDGANLVYEKTGSSDTVYTYGATLIKSSNGSATYVYVFNGHGDVVQLLAGTSVVKSYSYDAFGNEIGINMADTNPFRYCGEYYDKESETIYLRARYYSPAIGRFTQQDGWQFADPSNPLSLNLYTYCWNDPIRYHDPSGHNMEATAAWGSSMWWLCGADGVIPVGDIIYGTGLVVTMIIDGVNYIGINNIALYVSEMPNAVESGVYWIEDKVQVASDQIKQWINDIGGGNGAPSPGDPNWDGGFKNFRQLKKYLGSAGEKHQWHHVVEQCQIKRSGFDQYSIHNVKNVVSVPDHIHKQISAYYSSIPSGGFTNGQVFRDWLAGQSFQEQYEWGIKILKAFGVEV